MEGDLAVDMDRDTILEGGTPDQKRNNGHPPQGKDTPEDCTP